MADLSISSGEPERSRRSPFALSSFAVLVVTFAAAKLALHMLTARSFGYYCDELYAIDLSKHLAFGYVDLPPLTPALIAITRRLLGESLPAIRLVPALAGSATLVFVCLITRELGGRLFATTLCALGYLFCIFWLMVNSFFGYDCLDQLLLALFLFLLVRLIKTEDRKLWLALGLTAGVGLLAKATLLFFGPGFVIALLATRLRRHLLTAWPWLGAGLCVLISVPYVAWEIANGWPTLEFWRNYSVAHTYPATPLEYFVNVFLSMTPTAFPLIAAGLYRIFRPLGDRRYAFLGIVFLVTLAILFFLHAKYFMLAPLIVPLIAAGAIFTEELLSGPGWRVWARSSAIAVMVVGGVAAAPAGLPVLPLPQMQQYARTLGFFYQPVKLDNSPHSELPIIYDYRNGWENLVRTVNKVYESLPPQDRASCGGVVTEWFGPAGAIDLLGPAYRLPRAVSGHLTYYLWGPGATSWEVMIVVGRGDPTRSFEDVRLAATVTGQDTNPYLDGIPVYVCRRPKAPVSKIWPKWKYYY